MQKLSVFIITKNEAQKLPQCLAALQGLTDEVIVLDSGSTDSTEEIARQAGATFAYREFEGFGQQKYAAEQMCKHDWVLNLDADEFLSEDLCDEIKAFLSNAEDLARYDGGAIYIKNVLPHETRPRAFARSYNRIRLYNKTKLSFPRHSTFDNIDPAPGLNIYQFKNYVRHYCSLSIEDLEAKTRERTKFYFAQEKRGKLLKNIIRLPFEFFWSFFKNYILRGNFSAGWYGVKCAYIYAKYRFIRILQRVVGRVLVD